jgi:hypothetical protein
MGQVQAVEGVVQDVTQAAALSSSLRPLLESRDFLFLKQGIALILVKRCFI